MSEHKVDYHYFELVSAHPIFSAIIFVMIGLMVYLIAFIPQSMPDGVLVFVSLLLVFVYINFRNLRISISSDKLTVGFGIITQNVRINKIHYIETRKPVWYWYGGLGIRLGWDWSTGFIQNFKRGVQVTPKRGRKVFFSSNNPDALVNIVINLIQREE